ncbi:LPS export ABC transporter periplasmic protein LptC [Umboniibacter marinipuniceus]|uniref:LPS export ABC transporter protein LptC n=1 Tax=Umboniibacter marinipuniceus TaxID=569599 RepID=A0A3M0AK55_9GAMM|nr:LPS export ABC transporter periplasmic protein LptC [Umboniibacter marinipuniceus]RMA79442.1 LPS export ABC transporter protein LptC [Umboniibacter marinipuniceus]
MISQRAKVVIGFLVGCTAIYLLLIANQVEQAQPAPTEQVPPSLFLVDAEIRHYSNLVGNLEWQLNSPDLKYFEAAELMVAEQPTMKLYDQSDLNPWEVQAGRAAFYRRDDMIRLNQQVKLFQELGDGEYQLIETARIDYYPNEAFAQAIYPVTIDSHFGKSRGDRLKLWLAREYYELQGNVETYYEPTR